MQFLDYAYSASFYFSDRKQNHKCPRHLELKATKIEVDCVELLAFVIIIL